MATKFFKCPVCGNVLVQVCDSGVVPFCCGTEMGLLQAGVQDAAVEKHVPVFERVDDCTVVVRVGEEPHPMTLQHHICFIWLETLHGGQLRYLTDKGVDSSEAIGCLSAVGKDSGRKGDGGGCAAYQRGPGCVEKPEAEFCACMDPVVAVYEYCNLHGLWKADVCENLQCCGVKSDENVCK